MGEFPSKVRGKVAVHTWRGNKVTSKEGAFLVSRVNTGGIILGDNLAGHCFVLKDLVPMSFSK